MSHKSPYHCTGGRAGCARDFYLFGNSTSRTCSSLLCPSTATTEDLAPRGVWVSPRSRDRSRSRGRGGHRTLREEPSAEPEPGSLACDRVPNNEPEEEPAPRFEHSPLGVNPQQQAQGAGSSASSTGPRPFSVWPISH